jgi:serine acetyltransferase
MMGEGIVLYGGAAIIGKCHVGNNCWLSVNTVVMDADIPADNVVFGASPHLVRKPTRRNVTRDLFIVEK